MKKQRMASRERNISAKNITRFERLSDDPDAEVRQHAELILEIALVRPKLAEAGAHPVSEPPKLAENLADSDDEIPFWNESCAKYPFGLTFELSDYGQRKTASNSEQP